MFIIFSTLGFENNTMAEHYGNWNFPTPELFDEFWFDQNNTQFLYHALNYVIGKDTL